MKASGVSSRCRQVLDEGLFEERLQLPVWAVRAVLLGKLGLPPENEEVELGEQWPLGSKGIPDKESC